MNTSLRISATRWAQLQSVVTGQQEKCLALARLRIDFLRAERELIEKIESTDAAQRAIGEAALRELGLDPKVRDFTFGADGEVLLKVGDRWVRQEGNSKNVSEIPGAPWGPIPDDEWAKVVGVLPFFHTPEAIARRNTKESSDA